MKLLITLITLISAQLSFAGEIPALWTGNPCVRDFFTGTYAVKNISGGQTKVRFPLAEMQASVELSSGKTYRMDQDGCEAVDLLQEDGLISASIKGTLDYTKIDVRWDTNGKLMWIGINTKHYAVFRKNDDGNINVKIVNRKAIRQMFGTAFVETVIGEYTLRKL